MGQQISPLFQAVETEARKHRTEEKVFTGSAICRRAAIRKREIQMMRSRRHFMRKHAEQEHSRNGRLLTGELHPVEMEALEFLYPDLKRAGGMTDKKLWKRIVKDHPDIAAAPTEQVYH